MRDFYDRIIDQLSPVEKGWRHLQAGAAAPGVSIMLEHQLACFREIIENLKVMTAKFREVSDQSWETLTATRSEFISVREANKKAIERSRELMERVHLSTERLSQVFGRRGF